MTTFLNGEIEKVNKKQPVINTYMYIHYFIICVIVSILVLNSLEVRVQKQQEHLHKIVRNVQRMQIPKFYLVYC